ncbi:MAG: hypothetical protein J6Z14_00750 [Prevotella sp.]|nr:hypothetical protein [Prevotella sp.]
MKNSRLFSCLLLLLLALAAQAKTSCIRVKAGDAQSLLDAISQANQQNADAGTADRLFILVPAGYYDLGERTLTAITGHNISLVGQGMEQTVIRNAPLVEQEGISKTATILVRGTGTYLQDLTLRNDLDYYSAGAAGRAVCLQDKGQNTICLRVRMLSYQDTYYAYNEDAEHYLEDCEIHGTVDFICGAGDVYFRNCVIETEKRSLDGSGRCVIVAPRTSQTHWGYVFDGCTIRSNVSVFQYARGWNVKPRCVWLNTRLMQPELLREPRFDPEGMRTADNYFKEFGTTDADGRNITPKSNIVTFFCKEDTFRVETVMTPQEASTYSPKAVFPSWRPDKSVRQLEKQCQKLWR